MIGLGVLLLLLGTVSCALLAGCGRGARMSGPSWFDIVHDANRTARRARRS